MESRAIEKQSLFHGKHLDENRIMGGSAAVIPIGLLSEVLGEDWMDGLRGIGKRYTSNKSRQDKRTKDFHMHAGEFICSLVELPGWCGGTPYLPF